jgi:hypothetical protein
MKNKNILLAFTLLLISTVTIAQKKIHASKIMEDIKAGKSISINNATIIGVLDFTYKEEALKKTSHKKKSSWFNWNSNSSTNEIKKIIDVNISFTNCTFKDDVLAYIPDEDTGLTFTASFENETVFKNCLFERKAMFKYSRFEKTTDFSGSNFKDDSTFKYAKFDKEISFTNTTFNEMATFKYAKFNNATSFNDVIFKNDTTFKYSQFLDGVTFKNTIFKENLNIKYMKVSGKFDITNMKVGYEIDSKYTKINGKSFNKSIFDLK